MCAEENYRPPNFAPLQSLWDFPFVKLSALLSPPALDDLEPRILELKILASGRGKCSVYWT
jgi:hypothetical protein